MKGAGMMPAFFYACSGSTLQNNIFDVNLAFGIILIVPDARQL